MQALVDERITNKRAAALLYEHQIAANNVRHTFGAPGQAYVRGLDDPSQKTGADGFVVRSGRRKHEGFDASAEVCQQSWTSATVHNRF
jgi:hypothetical protein